MKGHGNGLMIVLEHELRLAFFSRNVSTWRWLNHFSQMDLSFSSLV